MIGYLDPRNKKNSNILLLRLGSIGKLSLSLPDAMSTFSY